MGMDNMIVEVVAEDQIELPTMCIPICSIRIMPGGLLLAVFGWGGGCCGGLQFTCSQNALQPVALSGSDGVF